MKRRIRGPVFAIGLAGLIALAGCSQDNAGGGSGTPAPASGSPASAASSSPSAAGKVSGDITVLAASSLTETFTTIGKNFEAANPGTKVTFSFGSSSTLATQVNQGAPADVFASADQKTMKLVTDAGNATDPTLFATNTLEIAVPPGNPAKITGLKDFADSSKKTVLCAKQVPCGSAAQQVFSLAKITPKPVSYETDVKAALIKVEQNEADAAMVYKTDVSSAGDKVQGVTFPEAQKVVNRYPVAALKESKNSAAAAAFLAYVTGPGEQVLQQAGFGAP